MQLERGSHVLYIRAEALSAARCFSPPAACQRAAAVVVSAAGGSRHTLGSRGAPADPHQIDGCAFPQGCAGHGGGPAVTWIQPENRGSC